MSISNGLTRAIAGLDILAPPRQYIAEILHAICDGLGYRFGSVIEVGNDGTGQMVSSYNLPAGLGKRGSRRREKTGWHALKRHRDHPSSR